MWKTKRYTHKELGEQSGVYYLTGGGRVRTYRAEGMNALKAADEQSAP